VETGWDTMEKKAVARGAKFAHTLYFPLPSSSSTPRRVADCAVVAGPDDDVAHSWAAAVFALARLRAIASLAVALHAARAKPAGAFFLRRRRVAPAVPRTAVAAGRGGEIGRRPNHGASHDGEVCPSDPGEEQHQNNEHRDRAFHRRLPRGYFRDAASAVSCMRSPSLIRSSARSQRV
jgi:hypothetical protein